MAWIQCLVSVAFSFTTEWTCHSIFIKCSLLLSINHSYSSLRFRLNCYVLMKAYLLFLPRSDLPVEHWLYLTNGIYFCVSLIFVSPTSTQAQVLRGHVTLFSPLYPQHLELWLIVRQNTYGLKEWMIKPLFCSNLEFFVRVKMESILVLSGPFSVVSLVLLINNLLSAYYLSDIVLKHFNTVVNKTKISLLIDLYCSQG